MWPPDKTFQVGVRGCKGWFELAMIIILLNFPYVIPHLRYQGGKYFSLTIE